MAFQELVLSTFREHKKKPQSDQAAQDHTIFLHIVGCHVLPTFSYLGNRTNQVEKNEYSTWETYVPSSY